MLFRNAQLYRLPKHWPGMTAALLAEQLARLPFQPIGQMDTQSIGWVAPVQDGAYVHTVGDQWLIALGVETRMLPAHVVARALAKRAEEAEAEQGYKPGRKQMKELKESIISELLPKAFTKLSKTYAWIDPAGGWLVVDASSLNRAEPLIEALHRSLDELPLKLLNTERSPAAAMTDWLASNEAPAGFSIDLDCELHAITDEASAVRYVRHSLEGEEIREHIASGKQVAKLALTFDDRMSFVFTDRGELKRIQPLDVLTENADQGDAKTREEQFDADFALITGELRRLIPALVEALGGEVQTV